MRDCGMRVATRSAPAAPAVVIIEREIHISYPGEFAAHAARNVAAPVVEVTAANAGFQAPNDQTLPRRSTIVSGRVSTRSQP